MPEKKTAPAVTATHTGTDTATGTAVAGQAAGQGNAAAEEDGPEFPDELGAELTGVSVRCGDAASGLDVALGCTDRGKACLLSFDGEGFSAAVSSAGSHASSAEDAYTSARSQYGDLKGAYTSFVGHPTFLKAKNAIDALEVRIKQTANEMGQSLTIPGGTPPDYSGSLSGHLQACSGQTMPTLMKVQSLLAAADGSAEGTAPVTAASQMREILEGATTEAERALMYKAVGTSAAPSEVKELTTDLGKLKAAVDAQNKAVDADPFGEAATAEGAKKWDPYITDEEREAIEVAETAEAKRLAAGVEQGTIDPSGSTSLETHLGAKDDAYDPSHGTSVKVDKGFDASKGLIKGVSASAVVEKASKFGEGNHDVKNAGLSLADGKVEAKVAGDVSVRETQEDPSIKRNPKAAALGIQEYEGQDGHATKRRTGDLSANVDVKTGAVEVKGKAATSNKVYEGATEKARFKSKEEREKDTKDEKFRTTGTTNEVDGSVKLGPDGTAVALAASHENDQGVAKTKTDVRGGYDSEKGASGGISRTNTLQATDSAKITNTTSIDANKEGVIGARTTSEAYESEDGTTASKSTTATLKVGETNEIGASTTLKTGNTDEEDKSGGSATLHGKANLTKGTVSGGVAMGVTNKEGENVVSASLDGTVDTHADEGKGFGASGKGSLSLGNRTISLGGRWDFVVHDPKEQDDGTWVVVTEKKVSGEGGGGVSSKGMGASLTADGKTVDKKSRSFPNKEAALKYYNQPHPTDMAIPKTAEAAKAMAEGEEMGTSETDELGTGASASTGIIDVGVAMQRARSHGIKVTKGSGHTVVVTVSDSALDGWSAKGGTAAGSIGGGQTTSSRSSVKVQFDLEKNPEAFETFMATRGTVVPQHGAKIVGRSKAKGDSSSITASLAGVSLSDTGYYEEGEGFDEKGNKDEWASGGRNTSLTVPLVGSYNHDHNLNITQHNDAKEQHYVATSTFTDSKADDARKGMARATDTKSDESIRGDSSGKWTVQSVFTEGQVDGFRQAMLTDKHAGDGMVKHKSPSEDLKAALIEAGNDADAQREVMARFVQDGGESALGQIRRYGGFPDQHVKLDNGSGDFPGLEGNVKLMRQIVQVERKLDDPALDLAGMVALRGQVGALKEKQDARVSSIANKDKYPDLPPELRSRELARARKAVDQLLGQLSTLDVLIRAEQSDIDRRAKKKAAAAKGDKATPAAEEEEELAGTSTAVDNVDVLIIDDDPKMHFTAGQKSQAELEEEKADPPSALEVARRKVDAAQKRLHDAKSSANSSWAEMDKQRQRHNHIARGKLAFTSFGGLYAAKEYDTYKGLDGSFSSAEGQLSTAQSKENTANKLHTDVLTNSGGAGSVSGLEFAADWLVAGAGYYSRLEYRLRAIISGYKALERKYKQNVRWWEYNPRGVGFLGDD